MPKEKKRITLYSHADCQPCRQIKKLAEKGQIDAGDADELDIVDVDTDKGFDRFEKEVLDKLPDDGIAPLPGAYMDGVPCGIMITDDDKLVVFQCPEKEAPKEAAKPAPAS